MQRQSLVFIDDVNIRPGGNQKIQTIYATFEGAQVEASSMLKI